MNKTKIDLDSDLILRSENVEYGGDTLNNYLGNKYVLLHDTIDSKGEFTLKDYVDNYDEIHIFATENYYNHRQICNIYRHSLWSSKYQYLQYSNSSWDASLKLYSNKIDTNETEIGTSNRHITGVYGVKY